MKEQKSLYPTPSQIKKKWVVIDATGQVLGRMASNVASLLRGKNNVIFTPSLDTGANIIIKNVEKVLVTGKKETKKKYYRHSGYPGGLKTTTYVDLFKKDPRKVVRRAVWGMVPHNRLGRSIIKNLKLYVGEEHPHQSQNPQEFKIPK